MRRVERAGKHTCAESTLDGHVDNVVADVASNNKLSCCRERPDGRPGLNWEKPINGQPTSPMLQRPTRRSDEVRTIFSVLVVAHSAQLATSATVSAVAVVHQFAAKLAWS